jgi:hypothetical protein
MQRRVFGSTRDEVMGCCRELHMKEPHKLCSQNIEKMKQQRNGWAGHVAHLAKVRNAYKVVFVKSEGKIRDHLADIGKMGE